MKALSDFTKLCKPIVAAALLAVFALAGTAFGQVLPPPPLPIIAVPEDKLDYIMFLEMDENYLPIGLSGDQYGTREAIDSNNISSNSTYLFDKSSNFINLYSLGIYGDGKTINKEAADLLSLLPNARILAINDVSLVGVSNLTITGGTHTIGSRPAHGGGAVFQNFDYLNLTGVTFHGNTANGTGQQAAGGGASIEGETAGSGITDPLRNAVLSGVLFTDNVATGTGNMIYGGGLMVAGIEDFSYNGGRITGNTARNTGTGKAGGGGLWFEQFDQDAYFTDIVFESNNATSAASDAKGGAFAVVISDKVAVLDQVTFGSKTDSTKANVASAAGTAEGGAMYSETVVTISNSLFGNNKAIGTIESAGGALRVNGNTLLGNTDIAVINDTTFTNNTAVSDKEAYGGGFFIAGSSSIWNGATGNVSLTDVVVDGNLATGTGSGSVALGAGGIVKNVGSFTFENGTVNNNTTSADHQAKGGGLFLTYINGKVDIDNVEFLNNAANSANSEAFGGALMIDNQKAGTWQGQADITLNNVLFEGNEVVGVLTSGGVNVHRGGLGGAIYTDSDMTITGDSAFKNNWATTNGVKVKNDIHLHSATGIELTLSPGDGKMISFDGGITGDKGTVNMTGGGTVAFTSDDSQQTFDDKLKANVGAGTTLQTGMYKNNGVWTSNVIATGTDSLTFESGSVWYVQNGLGYDGETLAGNFQLTNAGNVANAQAALVNGNAANTFFEFQLLGGTGANIYQLGISARKNANLSPTATMASAFISPGRMFSGTKHQFDAFRNSWQSYSRKQWYYLGQSTRQTGFGTGAAWVNWVGRSNEYATNYAMAAGQNMKLDSNGVQIGTDIYQTHCAQLGVMFGYESHEASILNDRTTGNDLYVGLYMQRLIGCSWDVRGTVGYGQQSYDGHRFDYVGSSWNAATFGGNTFESTLEIGRHVPVSCLLSLRPVVGLDILNTTVGAHGEIGGQNAIAFGDATLTQALLRVGSDLTWTRRHFTFNGGAYYSYNFADRDYTQVWVTNGFGNVQKAVGTDLGRSVFTANAGVSYYLDTARRYALFGNYFADFYTYREGSPTGHTGMVGLSAKF